MSDIIITALREIAEHDQTDLVAERLDDNRVRVSFRAMGLQNTYPLFDPVSGETALEGVGATYEEALDALRRVLEPFFPPYPEGQPRT